MEKENDVTAVNWGAVPDWIVAAAAIAALLVYVTQTAYMAAAQSHMETEQRAWISISEPKNLEPLKSGHALKMSFVVKNLGMTPARIRAYFVRSTPLHRWHGFSQDTSVPVNVSPNPTIIPPGGERELVVYDVTSVLTEEDEQKLTGLMVQIVVTYLDAFGNERLTVACFDYAPKVDVWNEFGLDDGQRME